MFISLIYIVNNKVLSTRWRDLYDMVEMKSFKRESEHNEHNRFNIH